MSKSVKTQPGVGRSVLVSYLNAEQFTYIEDATKQSALEAVIQKLDYSYGKVTQQQISDAVFEREALMSTGIGLGVAVPHVRLPGIKKLTLVVGVCKAEIEDYESLDGQPVQLIFLIVANSNQHHEYIKLLAALSGCIKNRDIRDQLNYQLTPEAFCKIMTEGGA